MLSAMGMKRINSLALMLINSMYSEFLRHHGREVTVDTYFLYKNYLISKLEYDEREVMRFLRRNGALKKKNEVVEPKKAKRL